jgi:hypothetical protein
MDTLRVMAQRSADPNSCVLAERCIAEYLRTPGAALQKLSSAIDREAEACRRDKTFWNTMQEFVRYLGQLDA